jgi:hypothetical protein
VVYGDWIDIWIIYIYIYIYIYSTVYFYTHDMIKEHTPVSIVY